MKRCPKCSRTFPDDNQKFCTIDGSSLVTADQAFDPNATVHSSAPKMAPPPVATKEGRDGRSERHHRHPFDCRDCSSPEENRADRFADPSRSSVLHHRRRNRRRPRYRQPRHHAKPLPELKDLPLPPAPAEEEIEASIDPRYTSVTSGAGCWCGRRPVLPGDQAAPGHATRRPGGYENR